jgi:hypothetical protein
MTTTIRLTREGYKALTTMYRQAPDDGLKDLLIESVATRYANKRIPAKAKQALNDFIDAAQAGHRAEGMIFG